MESARGIIYLLFITERVSNVIPTLYTNYEKIIQKFEIQEAVIFSFLLTNICLWPLKRKIKICMRIIIFKVYFQNYVVICVYVLLSFVKF